MTRLGSLAGVLVCVGALGAGCASGPNGEIAPAGTETPAAATGQPALPDDPQPTAATAPLATTTEPASPTTARDPAPTTTEPPAPTAAGEAGAEQEPEAVEASEASDTRVPVSLLPPLGDDGSVARWTVEIVESVPHDPGAFTQGLEVADGTMYESTGLWGQSSLRAVNPATGEVTAQVDLPDEFFGEGLTVVGDEILQLTWQSGTARVYDRATLSVLRENSYEGEGWGLCEMDGELIMTDGSDRLARRDPRTFELLGSVTATAAGYDGPLHNLNELECVDGMVIANVWQTDRLLVIDASSGRVAATIDAGVLVDDVSQKSTGGRIDVLNGVAVDEKTATLWMTGKLWPRLYRVRVVEVR